MRLPNLLIAGAPKSGTSALFRLLGQHPDIFLSQMKEPKFFVSETLKQIDEPIVKWIDTFDKYQELYKTGQDYPYIIDASAFYLSFHQEAIPKIVDKLGDPHILIILRNPIQRAFSAYKHMRRNNPEELEKFENCIDDDNKRKINHPLMLYKEMGLYTEAVKAYQAEFSKVKVLIYEEFFQDAEKNIEAIWAFLQIDRVEVQNKEVNKKAYEWKSKSIQELYFKKNLLKNFFSRVMPGSLKKSMRKMSTKTQTIKLTDAEARLLKDFYKEDVDKLSAHLNKDLKRTWDLLE